MFFMNKFVLEITRTKNETEDTRSFYFKTKEPFSYQAGQFITLLLSSESGNELRRSYSLASSPCLNEPPFFTVKRIENGEASRFLFEKIQQGNTLLSLPSSGKFVLDQPMASVYFFIAAGSGIIPIFSLIKELLHCYPFTQIILIYQCTNEQNIIYEASFKQLAQQFSERFQWHQYFSRPLSKSIQPTHFNNKMLMQQVHMLLAEKTSVQFYICGPLRFMRMAEFTLKTVGFASAQIHKEQFVVSLQQPKTAVLPYGVFQNVLLHFQNKTYRFQVAYPKSILQAALEQEIDLPYSCKGGVCSTCMAKCIKGKVLMLNNEVLTEKDLEKGWVLTCVGYAATDVELLFQ
jgi:ring-1,2-phenylacetyl-CoA epoxidase subunit PaaE